MNIKSTINRVNSPAHQVLKPRKDYWETDKGFAMRLDVDELVQVVESDSRQSVPAEYRFSFHQNLSTSDRLKKAGRKARQVAGVTALGLGGAIALAGIGNTAVNATGLSNFVGSGISPTLGMLAATGAVVGGFAALGAAIGFMGPDHHKIQGQVNKTEDGLKFVSDDEKFSVDIGEYSQATVPPKVGGKRDFGDQWWIGAPINAEYSPESAGEERWK